jgi:hypothetical protein
MEVGIYNGFNFVASKAEVDTNIVYKSLNLSCIITGNYTTVQLINYDTNAVLETFTSYTHEIGGEEIKSFRLDAIISSGVRAVVRIDNTFFSDHIIQGINPCDAVQFRISNNCNNQYFNWEAQSNSLLIRAEYAQQLTPTIESEDVIIINEKGQRNKTTRLVQRHRIEFVAPSNWIKYYECFKINSDVTIRVGNVFEDIINTQVEAQESDAGYSKFILSYEFKDTITSGNSCCDDINIDDIDSPDTPSGEGCGDFMIEINESSGNLTVSLTDPPTGTPTYKWYRDNVYLSNANNINISSPGNYRVDVRVGECSKTASYFQDNICNLFQLDITNVNNEINATTSNDPDGETVSFNVLFEGASVATSLPYEAETTGIYYIEATAGPCKRVRGIFVNVEDEDCSFDLDIIDNGLTLEADTDASTPTYLWELETEAGKVTIGAAAEINKQGKGIYWLTVTSGTCSKQVYKFFEAVPGIIVVMNRANGTEHIVTDLQLTIADIQIKLQVYVNGVLQTYVINPVAANQYGFTNDGKLKTFSTLNNATIKIIYQP